MNPKNYNGTILKNNSQANITGIANKKSQN